jgi:hypothetical protein
MRGIPHSEDSVRNDMWREVAGLEIRTCDCPEQ